MKRWLFIFAAIIAAMTIWLGIAVLTFEFQPDMVHVNEGG